MALSIKDLVSEISREDVLQDFLNVGAAIGLTTTAWQSGEPIYDLLAIFSDIIAELWNGPIVKAIRAMFLDYAEGDWLSLFTWTSWETARQEETFASGQVTLENRGASFYNLGPGDIRLQHPVSKKTYTSITGGVLAVYGGVGAYPVLTVNVRADEAGTRSNALAGAFAGYPTPPLSALAGVYVQSNAAILGSDEETDVHLAKRARLSTGLLSPAGPRAAYEYAALSTRLLTLSDGSVVPILPRDPGYDGSLALNINRAKVREPGNGTVYVDLASPSGPADGAPSLPGTDVYYANVVMQTRIVPPGLAVAVSAATAHAVALGTITVYVDRDSLVTASEAQADATDAINGFFSTLQIGGNKVDPSGSGYVFLAEVLAKASESNKGIFLAQCSVTPPDGFPATPSVKVGWALADNEVAVPSFTVTAELVTQ